MDQTIIAMVATLPEVKAGISGFFLNQFPVVWNQVRLKKQILEFLHYWGSESILLPIFVINQSAVANDYGLHTHIYWSNDRWQMSSNSNASGTYNKIHIPVLFKSIYYYDRFAQLHIVEDITPDNWPEIRDHISEDVFKARRYLQLAHEEFTKQGRNPKEEQDRFYRLAKEIADAHNFQSTADYPVSSSSSSNFIAAVAQQHSQHPPAHSTVQKRKRWADADSDSDESDLWGINNQAQSSDSARTITPPQPSSEHTKPPTSTNMFDSVDEAGEYRENLYLKPQSPFSF